MQENIMFKCDCCGVCCRNIRGVKFLEAFDDGSGVCIHLDSKSNLCRIYDTRPVYCNVDAMYELFFADSMSRENFYEANYKACSSLKRTLAL